MNATTSEPRLLQTQERSLLLERILTVILMIAAGAFVTGVFDRVSPDLTAAPLFSAVLAYWILFFTFYFGIFLGLGLEGPRSPDVTMRRAIGTAIAFVGTVASVLLTFGVTPEGTMALNQDFVYSLLPLHWGFVWLVFMQHLGLD
ncbi:MAG: hypothetical protein Kow00129_17130 [Thermoleophilia bacterium]